MKEGAISVQARLIKRVFHINIVVRDLDRSLVFYTDVLGMHILEGPYDGEGPGMAGIAEGAQMWGVNPNEAKVRFAFLRFGDDENEPIFDVLEFVSPRSWGAPNPTLQNVGLARIALEVSNVREAFDHLTARGVKFVTGPCRARVGDGRVENIDYCCFYDPDGTILEIYGPAGSE